MRTQGSGNFWIDVTDSAGCRMRRKTAGITHAPSRSAGKLQGGPPSLREMLKGNRRKSTGILQARRGRVRRPPPFTPTRSNGAPAAPPPLSHTHTPLRPRQHISRMFKRSSRPASNPAPHPCEQILPTTPCEQPGPASRIPRIPFGFCLKI